MNALKPHANRGIVLTLGLILALAAPVHAAAIGVLQLADNRQLPNLSLLDSAMSAARNALIADGHTVSAVSSLSAASLTGIDILWLPLLDSEAFYTQAERDAVNAFLTGGGRLFWIGDAGVYNLGDESLLSIFGITKLSDTFDTDGPVLANSVHPVASGPYGASAAVVAASASFGLMNMANVNAPATSLYTDAAGPGAFIALVERTPGAAAGRAALVCDSTIFADALDEGAGHRTLLRNLVAWLGKRASYTPSGGNVTTGAITGAGAAIPGITVNYAQVTSTGFTTITPLAGGAVQCDFAVAPFTGMSNHYVAFGFQLTTTATLAANQTISFTVHYDEAAFIAAGFRDEAAIQLYRYDAATSSAVAITTGRDMAANILTGSASALGGFLVGVQLDPTDCDANGMIDACEIEADSVAPNGPFYCIADCDADCNENGIPDACDVRTHVNVLSPTLTPIGAGSPQTWTYASAPRAVGNVTLSLLGRGDFSATAEYVTVKLNNSNMGRVFETGYGADCPATPVTSQITVTKDQFNTLVNGGDAIFSMTASTAVDPNLCNPASSIRIRIEYDAESVGADCNANGIPDDCEASEDCNNNGQRDICEIARGDAGDCNENGVPDACDLSSGASEDCNGNEVPDDCENDARLTLARTPVEGGAVQPVGVTDYPLCDDAAITATPAAGYCFTGWTVDVGAPPVDPAAASTTVLADFDKTVTGRFTKILVSQPVDKLGCPGGVATFSVGVDPLLEPDATYQWRRNGANVSGPDFTGGNAAQLSISPVGAANVGAYDCVVTLPCGTVTTTPATLGIGGDTTITTNLPSTSTVCAGQTATLTVAATGVSLAYQWQRFDGANFVDMAATTGITGVTAASLVLTNAQIAIAGDYRCVVTGTCGATVTSATTTLVVTQAPTVTTPGSSQTLCEGEPFTTSIAATGSNLTYEWWYSSGGTWRALTASDAGVTGIHSDTLTIDPTLPSHTGSYRCIVAGACAPLAQSEVVQLTVRAKTKALSQPASLTRCPGAAASFTCAASGTNIVFQWQFDSGGGFVDLSASSFGVSGYNTATLSIPSVGAAHAGSYRCVVTGDCGQTAMSNVAQLAVTAVTVITNSNTPSDTSSCPGGRVVFAVEATGSNLTYQWQANTGAAFLNLTNGARITGAQSSTLILTGVAASDAGLYQCVVAGGCGNAQVSRQASLTITSSVCDCNGNSVSDADDIATGVSADCNANGIPDECELAVSNPAPGGPFYCTEGCLADCNENGMIDSCDIASGDSTDCNANGTPDECETGGGAGADCNANGIPDACDISSGNSADCNKNGIPDECDPPYIVDAGPDVTRCVGQTTVTLGGETVASGSRPPYQYLWTIQSGPNGATLQSSTAAHAIFQAAQAGDYVVQLRVSDATTPPCVKTDTVTVHVYQMTVDAGPAVSVGAGLESPALSPAVSGANGDVSYQWSIVAGSPSTGPAQFTGGGATVANPTFTPTTPGRYTLRLTVRDSNDPAACEVSDTVTLDAILMTLAVPADFPMCVGGESSPINVTITSPGIAPYSYDWTIEAGSPSAAASQFGGAGPHAASPTFKPTQSGLYTLRVTVTDSSTPPAVRSATLHVGAGGLAVNIPDEIALCSGAEGIHLPKPEVSGGVAPVTFLWTIEPGSASNDHSQFSEENAFSAEWFFSPDAPGSYLLRLRTTDSASPPCIRYNDLVVRATAMSVNAGPDFVTQAFKPSQSLGSLPLVAGGGPGMKYAWRILSGPATASAQFSSPTAERPVFSPSQVGTYAIEVTATDLEAGCSASDVVVVQAITASQSLAANAEGRVFFTLRIDDPRSGAEIRVANAAPGADFTGGIRDDGASAVLDGFGSDLNLSRRLTMASTANRGEFVALVGMYFDLSELNGADSRTIVLHAWDADDNLWRPAVGKSIETGAHPPRPAKGDIGRRGVEKMPAVGDGIYFAWAVVDYKAEFALGIAAKDAEIFNPAPNSGPDNPGGEDPAPGSTPPGLGSLCGASTGSGFLSLLAGFAIMRGAVRKRPNPRLRKITQK